MSEQAPNMRGTIIRGDDGSLYFIPDSELEPYRIDEENRQVVENDLERASAGADAARVSVSPESEAYTMGGGHGESDAYTMGGGSGESDAYIMGGESGESDAYIMGGGSEGNEGGEENGE